MKMKLHPLTLAALGLCVVALAGCDNDDALPVNTLPANVTTSASATNRPRIRPVVYPTARSKPTSRARCSTPSLKNRAASTSAEMTRKKLK